ncbi:MAG: hypothetical protein LBN05_09040 [Oscillospiraceae bacterium]|jgi:hypothetical protein|nr:hypothetical protein [Oscillospiraceae bacterium]
MASQNITVAVSSYNNGPEWSDAGNVLGKASVNNGSYAYTQSTGSNTGGRNITYVVTIPSKSSLGLPADATITGATMYAGLYAGQNNGQDISGNPSIVTSVTTPFGVSFSRSYGGGGAWSNQSAAIPTLPAFGQSYSIGVVGTWNSNILNIAAQKRSAVSHLYLVLTVTWADDTGESHLALNGTRIPVGKLYATGGVQVKKATRTADGAVLYRLPGIS